MKENFQLIYTLLDNQLRNINLPVTSIKFNNPKSGSNPDHYKILVATCKFFFSSLKTHKYSSFFKM
jgi:hypothetical protein